MPTLNLRVRSPLPAARPPAPEVDQPALRQALHLLGMPSDARFDRLTRLAAEVFAGASAHVALVDESQVPGMACCFGSASEGRCEAAWWEEGSAACPLLVLPDAPADPFFATHPQVAEAPHVHFYAGRPLRSVEGTVVGMFSLADPRPRAFGPGERRLFEALAQVAERELQQAQVIERQRALIDARPAAVAEASSPTDDDQQYLSKDLRRAARYVQSLLPPPITEGPVETEWVFIPSDELGGDAFGYHWLDADHFAMYLLDVTGHGIGAALHSVSVLNVLRTQTLRDADFHQPSEVLAALNRAFQMKAHDNLYFTIWYGVYHRPTRRLTYATGGHLPGLLVGPPEETPEVVRLRTGGPLIGGVAEADFPSASYTLPEGHTLYLLSDGVYEVRQADGAMMDLEQFVTVLTRHLADGEGGAQRLVSHLHQAFDCRRCSDDVSLLRLTFR